MRRCGLSAAVLAMVLVGGGCKPHTSKAIPSAAPKLTAEQEAATKEYVGLLEQQIDTVEQTAAILASIRDNAASREAGRDKLVQLSSKTDALERKSREQQPRDVEVMAAAAQRVSERQVQAAQKLLIEVRRINALPGGEDFFQKELRPLLRAVKGQ